MAEVQDPQTEVVRLLAEAAEWRLLGLLFEYPTEAWRAQLTALLPDLRDPDLVAMGQAALEFNAPGLHTALFGPAGSVCVREVKWRGGVQYGYLMAELNACYQAFNYNPTAEEVADHLAIQLGFVSYLKVKQALALAQGESEHAQVAAEATAGFLQDHIAISAEPVLQALETFAPDYLIDAGRRILHHAGPSPRSGYPLALPDELEDGSEEMTCGEPPPGESLIQIES